MWWCQSAHLSGIDFSSSLYFPILAPSDYYDCYSNTPTAYDYYNNGSRAGTAYAQLCVNDTYYPVCSSGLDEADVQLICTNRGAQYGYLAQSQDIEDRFYPPITPTGIVNLNCPEGYDYFDPYSCSYQVTYDYCNANGGLALVTCIFVGKITRLTSTASIYKTFMV